MMYFIVIEALMLVILVYMLFYLMQYKNLKSLESMSSYECGFEPMSTTRMSFSYRFFLISILFLIFDVEISIMLPIPFLVSGWFSKWIFFIFVLVLLLGLAYEYMYGALEWVNNYMSKA